MKRVLRILTVGVLSAGLVLTANEAAFPKAAEAAATTFKDTIPAWAASSVQTAVQAGILNGYPDGTFKPNNPISRSELLKVMALTFGLEVNTNTSGAWYLPYKTALMNAKIYMANDYTGDIAGAATRNEMAKLAVRGAKAEYRGQALSAAELMFRAVNAGLLVRTGVKADTIDTAGTTTRAQAAVLITRLLKLQNGGTLTVDKGASSAAEIAWHRHNMITMLGQNDLVTLPYRANIRSTYDVIIDKLIILDLDDEDGYYAEYVKDAEKPEKDGLLFAYKLIGKNLVVNTETQSIPNSFYMFTEGESDAFLLPAQYRYRDMSVKERSGLFENRTQMSFTTENGEGHNYNFTYVYQDFIDSQIKLYGGFPIHLERYGRQMNAASQFYLTEVKDLWAY